MGIGERLRKLTRESGFTQAELGRRVGVSRATAAAWMAGTRAISMKHVKLLAELFSVSVSDLIDEDNVLTVVDEDEINMVASFRAMPIKSRAALLELVDLLKDR